MPHHLIDIVDPADEYSVAQYVDAAAAAVADIRARGKRAAVRRRHAAVSQEPAPRLVRWSAGRLAAAPRNRAEELQHVGQQALYDRLAQVDPVAASHIHPHDTRRLIRALEVFRATGEPISHQQLQFEEGRPADECRVFVLRRQREELHARIEGRVEAMIDAGLVDEVEHLVATGGPPVAMLRRAACSYGLGRTARQAVGYREALAYLAGEYDHDEMVARIKARTRRFAKRQGTWFRSLSECRFVDLAGDVDANAVAERIVHGAASPDASNKS